MCCLVFIRGCFFFCGRLDCLRYPIRGSATVWDTAITTAVDEARSRRVPLFRWNVSLATFSPSQLFFFARAASLRGPRVSHVYIIILCLASCTPHIPLFFPFYLLFPTVTHLEQAIQVIDSCRRSSCRCSTSSRRCSKSSSNQMDS